MGSVHKRRQLCSRPPRSGGQQNSLGRRLDDIGAEAPPACDSMVLSTHGNVHTERSEVRGLAILTLLDRGENRPDRGARVKETVSNETVSVPCRESSVASEIPTHPRSPVSRPSPRERAPADVGGSG